MLFESRPLNRVGRAKAMLERRSATEAAELCLNHRAQIAGRVMTKFDYAAGFTFENDDHAFSDLGCWNCHYCLVSNCDGLTDGNGLCAANDVVWRQAGGLVQPVSGQKQNGQAAF